MSLHKSNLKTHLFLLNTILPLGKLEVVLITTEGNSTNIVLQGVTDGTSTDVGILKVTK